MSDQRNGGIVWCEQTWNPIRGCSRVSEGCRNCYAESMAARFCGVGQPYEGTINPETKRWNGKVRLVPEHLQDPLRWTRPRMVFVNSMSDLFHESVPFEFIDKVFAVMALAGQHTMQILSKRPRRMLEYFDSNPFDRVVSLIYNATHEQRTDTDFERAIRDRFGRIYLADSKKTRTRSEAWRRLLQRSKSQSLSKSESGIHDQRRLSSGVCYDQQGTGSDWGASSGVALFQPSDTKRVDNQSQERSEGLQSTRQFGIGNVQRATTSCDTSIGSEASRCARVETSKDTPERGGCFGDETTEKIGHDGERHCGDVQYEKKGDISNMLPSDVEAYLTWPLPNVWIGCTVENQQAADERIPLLLQTPAAVRWVSIEPCLSSIDLAKAGGLWSDMNGNIRPEYQQARTHLDWIVCGGESGPNARPMSPQWARDLRDQCAASGTPFLFKQFGEYGFEPYPKKGMKPYDSVTMGGDVLFKCGKKSAGRLLDGVQHDGYPEVKP